MNACINHRWCRETGSSAIVCLVCAAVEDHGHVWPNERVDWDSLAKFASWCHCGEFYDR